MRVDLVAIDLLRIDLVTESRQVDLVRVDLVAIDLVRIDLVTPSLYNPRLSHLKGQLTFAALITSSYTLSCGTVHHSYGRVDITHDEANSHKNDL